jgi:type IV pilus assembly protein PilB
MDARMSGPPVAAPTAAVPFRPDRLGSGRLYEGTIMARRRKRLGEILMHWNVLGKSALREALQVARDSGKRVGEALVELGFVGEEDVTKALAAQYDMEYVDLDKIEIPADAWQLIPETDIKERGVLPLGREDGRLRVIITDPLDLETIDALTFRVGGSIETVLASRTKVRQLIESTFSDLRRDITDTMQMTESTVDVRRSDADGDEDVTDVDGAPIIRLLDLIIAEAFHTRASDIHIEPMANRVRVRYRIDGVCLERDTIPKRMQGAVIARLKIMSGIDIAEKRLPQDGRIKRILDAQQIDFRVSTLPGYHGESVVLRLLTAESASRGIQALGFGAEDYQVFLRIIKRPNGIFLVTGPTGSGKTTTLYAALQELNKPDRKIITAEDPVEYHFTGLNQCQVHEEIGMTFPAILRSMLRQAPEIILVGEIRDHDTAEIAIQAALTGHLVFSTLHTNDAPSAITRLIDMGVKPFLVASSIQAIMAQRLLRTICKDCKEVDPNPDRFLMQQLGIEEEMLRDRPLYRGRGCRRCNHTGYRGRLGIFELMIMNSDLREMAFNRTPTNLLRRGARASGMRTLQEDGVQKALNGITTVEEVMRVTARESITTG